MVGLTLVAVGIALGAAAGCADREGDGTRIVRPAAGVEGSRSSQDEAGGAEAKRRFHAGNRSDWVGVAHNRAMDEYRARLRSGVVSRDLCNDLAEFSADPRRLPEHARGGAASRQQGARLARRVLRTTPFCGGQLAAGSLGESLHLVQGTELSAEARAVLDQIESAAQLASWSGDLAVRLGQILAASSWLPADEYALVEATASVAQSSAEYWEANIAATHADFTAAYGDCMQTAVSVEDGAQRCLGLGARVSPTSFGGVGSPTLRFIQRAIVCPGYNGREILGDDVKGAITGGIVGSLAGGAGAGPGALWGATAGSLGAFGWQFAQLTYCMLSGGGDSRPPVRPSTT